MEKIKKRDYSIVPASTLLTIFILSIIYEFWFENLIGFFFSGEDYKPETLSKRWEYVIISTTSAFLALIYPTWIGRKLLLRQEELTDQLQRLASEDSLTGLFTRRIADNFLEKELNRFQRFQKEFSVVMVDIDNFKSVNDKFGHQIGDSVLKEISNLLSENVRQNDLVSRWGGEEFLIICPETSIEGAKLLALKLRKIIEEFSFSTINNKTASFGVTCSQPGQEIRHLIQKADEALYQAKKLGRNRVESRR